MIFISHRGNLEGPNHSLENSPAYIDKAIEKGFDVEIDLRLRENKPFLGHDEAQYEVTKEWLQQRKNNLWIHVKEYESLVWLKFNLPDAMYFCHESDKFTLTSNGYVWSHDLNNEMKNYCIVPLIDLKSVRGYSKNINFHAVCTDYVYEFIKKYNL